MRSLVAYYSFGGNTKEMARTIARELDADLMEIRTKDRIEAEKFMSYYWGGEKEVPEKGVPIESPEKDVGDYDLVVIGTPVWAWSPAPPVQTFLRISDMKGKSVAIFSTSEGDNGKTFLKMRQLLGESRIISKKGLVIQDPLDINVIRKEAASWARSLKKLMH